MDEQFTFFYVIGIVLQDRFDDNFQKVKSAELRQIVGEGHIIHSGRLLCKESKEVLKNRLKGVAVKVSKVREKGVPLCKDCQEQYKSISSSAWAQWTSGESKSGGVELKSVKL